MDNRYNYMMLGRLQRDCEYYLGYVNRNTKYLWAENEQEHINEMKRLYNSFSDENKPEWLTWDQILNYEKRMLEV